MSYDKACKAAFDYYAKRGKKGICEVNDLGDAWLFAGGDPDAADDGGYAGTVDKDSGKIAPFILPDRANFKRLQKAVPVEIPKKYAF